MMPTELDTAAEAFRTAIRSHDFPRADFALQKYVAWFRSHSPSVQQIEDARSLIEWGVQVTQAHQARLSEDLGRLEAVFNAYRPGRRLNTWRLQG